jgi:hypothetical protein
MTDDTDNTVDIDDVNLEDFEKDFFNANKEAPVEEPVEEEVVDEEIGDDHPATDEDEEAEDEPVEEESEDEEEDDEEEEEPEEDPKPKRNRKSAKERIEELVAKQREAERAADRREAELLERIKNLEARTPKEESQSKDVKALLPPEAPSPDATGKDGEPLYPLGEFDPLYIRDLTKFTIEQERKTMREEEEQTRKAREEQAVRQQIADEWMDRVEEVEKEIPELRDNMKSLADTFADLEPNYGEYLASTIMISEVGPQIMNYLSQNIGEAQKIVASGPAAATLALGRLEARLLNSSTKQDEKRNTKQVSKAPAPPTERSRGARGQFAVSPDTDDLEAFERVFYK